MRRRLLLLTFVALATTCCGLKQKAAQMQQAQDHVDRATEEAKRFFTTISIANSETQSLWGMSDFRVFGRDEITGMIGAGQVSGAKVADSPETFEAIIPLWCEGTRLDGQAAKLRRKLSIKLFGTEDESKFEITSYEFREDMPLSFSRQLLTWMGWSFIGPFLMFAYIWFGFVGGWTKAALFITRILTLPLAGYAAHILFGTAEAVVICLLVYVIVASALVMTVTAIRKR